MRLYSAKLEATALKSITESNETISGWLFSKLDADDFSQTPSSEFYRRIRNLTNKKGIIPRWDDLLEDLAISEDARDEMDKSDCQIISSKREAKLIVDRLDQYRRARIFYKIQREIGSSIKADQVDLEELSDIVGDMLSETRKGGNLEDHYIEFGGKLFDKKGLIDLLTAEDHDFIPTGFRAFDSINQGVPRSSAFVIAGETGAGKCIDFNTEIITSEGIQQIGKIWESFDTPIDKYGFKQANRDLYTTTHMGNIRKIKAAFKTSGKPIRITFDTGDVVVGLPEHMLWVLDKNEKTKFCRLDEISIGDKLPLSNPKDILLQLLNQNK